MYGFRGPLQNRMRAPPKADRIIAFFEQTDDTHLYERYNESHTNMSWYLHALRHTLHHQGGLNALAVFHKIDIGGWDGE